MGIFSTPQDTHLTDYVYSNQEEEFLSLEKTILFADTQPEIIDVDNETPCRITKEDLCDALVDVSGVLLPKKSTGETKKLSEYVYVLFDELWERIMCTRLSLRRFIYTETSANNMRSLALAVCQGHPILLEGVSGAGKTSLVSELATVTGNDSILICALDAPLFL